MEWFNKHSGLFALIALFLTFLMVLGSLLFYFERYGYSEGNTTANIQNLNERITKIEGDYRLILTVLLNNNKAVAYTVKQSNIPYQKKNHLLQKLNETSQELQKTLMQKELKVLDIHHDKQSNTPKNANLQKN
jgi:predicted PurR-regulated permease PerM